MRQLRKTISLAAAVCVALPTLVPTPAQARTFERCDIEGNHCVRVTCDHDGDRCWRESQYYKERVYRHRGHWVCDADRDRCHYVYTGRKWNPHWDEDHDHERDHDHDHDR